MVSKARARQNALDRRRRAKLDESIVKDMEQFHAALLDDAVSRLLSIPLEDWERAARADAQHEANKIKVGAVIEADLQEAKPWEAVMSQGSDVMRLAFQRARYGENEESRLGAELTTQRAKAYEQELQIQANRLGCPEYSAALRIGPQWAELNNQSMNDARSIVKTFNNDMASKIAKIRQETPTANRNTYAKQVGDWGAERAVWKDKQVGQFASNSARSMAQKDFHRNNGISAGTATLEPRSAKCPICQGFIDRGEVPLEVAMANPGPYHTNCCPGDTLVLMADGTERRIDEVQVGELVASRRGPSRVLDVFKRDTMEALYFISAGNRTLAATGNHPVGTYGWWTLAEDVHIGDLIEMGDGSFEKVTEVRVQRAHFGTVYNLRTEHEEFVAAGIVVHNCPHLWDTNAPRIADVPGGCDGLWRPGQPPKSGPMSPVSQVIPGTYTPPSPVSYVTGRLRDEAYEDALVQISTWTNSEGVKIAQAALDNAYSRSSPYQLIITKVNDRIEAVASYLVDENRVLIQNIASSGRVSGIGTDLLRQVGQVAMNASLPLEADATIAARSYYEKLGMKLVSGYSNRFRFELNDLKIFLGMA